MHIYQNKDGTYACRIPTTVDNVLSVSEVIIQAANNYSARVAEECLGKPPRTFTRI